MRSVMAFLAVLFFGLISPIHTYAFGPFQNVTKSVLSPSPLNISTDSYNVSAVITSMTLLEVIFGDTIRIYPNNPMVNPLLHENEVSEALSIVQEALRNTTAPVEVPQIPCIGSVIGTGGPGSPVVNLKNLSPAPVCYYVEFSNGQGNFPLPDICDCSRDAQPVQMAGIVVPPNCSTEVYAGYNFNGPFNEIVGGELTTIEGKRALVNGTRGARHEINFDIVEDGVWYDISYEFGLSNSRLGPSSLFPFKDSLDYRKNSGSRGHIQGEADILAKANKAWSLMSTDDKKALAKYDQYLVAGSSQEGGNGLDLESSYLVRVKHDKNAPAIVKYFFQVTADIQAYVYHGSVPVEAGLTEDQLEALMRPISDTFSYYWDDVNGSAKNMTIVAYSQL